MAKLIFGIGTLSIGGIDFGELQDATVGFSGELEYFYKPAVANFPVTAKVKTNRGVRISASYAKLSVIELQKILGGTIVSNTLTIYKDSDLGEFSLTLKNPNDGSDLQFYFPKVKSNGNVEFGLVQDDILILNPTFVAYYDEVTGKLVEITIQS